MRSARRLQHLLVDPCFDIAPEVDRYRGQFEVEASFPRSHARSRDVSLVLEPYQPVEDVQLGVGAHQEVERVPIDLATDRV